ncbi:MAG: acyl-CoA dehydrogenase [Amycolatopsis sp.]|jgi:acyl-CoA dehydrogenase|uniref:acyl-CoA dehydrogenase family protein n=1 Tax=Amycolatopsis sp. TaxID=37632 RepID=UPI00260ED6B3|nr:acyl-CoA dehydrogenase family protein [Amycolatopsis sp.]MCU1686678.1 acyl-CoA dehydrogenase [Amycolatopsis sp.]
MFQLDDRLLALRRQTREWAADFRELALPLDADPALIAEHVDLPGVRFMSTSMIPPEYGPPLVRIDGYHFAAMSALERVVLMEELAWGDAGVLLGSPGGSMSAVLMDILADAAQKEFYYSTLLARPTWTFFALTEAGGGSDPASMRSALSVGDGGGPALLNGTKRYIGNGARATLGVVFARVRPGPLGITAVLVDTADPGFHAEPIETIGLRGVQVSELRLNDVEIADDRILGRHLSPTRRGMWACVQTFDRLRPAVAAVAVGVARAAYEYVLAERLRPTKDERDRLDLIGRRIEGARQLVLYAGAAVDSHSGGRHLASAAKARACRLAEDVTFQACDFLGPGARFEHPLLDKLVRDARGVEFMEGTRTMQMLTLYQCLVSGKINRADPLGIGDRGE